MEKVEAIGKVTGVKTVGSSGRGSSSGVYITFETDRPIINGEVVHANVNFSEKKKWESFKVIEVETTKDYQLKCTAKEYGSRDSCINEGDDIRDAIVGQVDLITDKDYKQKLAQWSTYC